jgi:two-component system chemotaxis response regulator CheB
MDGIQFLKTIMSQKPIPVVIISTLTSKGSKKALEALELGAIDVVEKPSINTKNELLDYKTELCNIIKTASMSKLLKRTKIIIKPVYSADVLMRKPVNNTKYSLTNKIIAIGSSTGGTEALFNYLQLTPPTSPGIVIVQHMPAAYTAQFASRLNTVCQINIKEAKNNDPVLRGQVLIAPGGKHMMVIKEGSTYKVRISDGPLVNRHRPSVDVLFRSVARACGPNAIGVLLTGMGTDGAQGMLEMKQAKAHTISQSEKTCVVYGMPKAAEDLKAVDMVMDLLKIPSYIASRIK